MAAVAAVGAGGACTGGAACAGGGMAVRSPVEAERIVVAVAAAGVAVLPANRHGAGEMASRRSKRPRRTSSGSELGWRASASMQKAIAALSGVGTAEVVEGVAGVGVDV